MKDQDQDAPMSQSMCGSSIRFDSEEIQHSAHASPVATNRPMLFGETTHGLWFHDFLSCLQIRRIWILLFCSYSTFSFLKGLVADCAARASIDGFRKKTHASFAVPGILGILGILDAFAINCDTFSPFSMSCFLLFQKS